MRKNATYVAALEAATGESIDSDWSTYRVRTDLGVATEVLSAKFGRQALAQRLSAFIDDYLRRLREVVSSPQFEPVFIEGALATLTTLKRVRDVTIGLATANVKGAAAVRLSKAGIQQLFDVCSFAEDGTTKSEIPRATIERVYSQNAEHKPERVLFIGDQTPDVLAAGDCGVEFIGIASDASHREKLSAAGCRRFTEA